MQPPAVAQDGRYAFGALDRVKGRLTRALQVRVDAVPQPSQLGNCGHFEECRRLSMTSVQVSLEANAGE